MRRLTQKILTQKVKEKKHYFVVNIIHILN